MTRSEMSSTSTVLTPSRRHFLLALICAMFAAGSATGQIVQSLRFEIPVSKDEASFEIIPAESDGLFLHRRVRIDNRDQLQLVKLDTTFSISWNGFLPLDARFELMGKRNTGKKLYLLFRHRELARKDLELVVMDNATGQFMRHKVRNYIPFVPTDFQITDRAAIVGGYFNSVPVVIYYSLLNNTTKVLPGLLNEAGELTQIKTDSTGAFDVLISAKNAEYQKTIWIKSYDPNGDILYQYPLKPEGNKHLIFARSVKTENNMQLVAGTYGGRNSNYSKGIFIASIDPSGLQQLKYYSYGDLNNFFKYMKVKREMRVKERIERRRIRGQKVRFNYRFIVHEIVPYNNQFVLLGEAFYPKYVQVDRTSYHGFFNPFLYAGGPVRNGRIFDGYRYTHAVVMGFDQNGKLIWDNSFEINDVKTFSLEQFVKLEMQKEKIALLYAFNNELRSKIIQGNEVLEGKTYFPIKTNYPGDIAKLVKSASSKLNYWYGDYFYAFGVQELTNAASGSRRVFFVNKISYSDSAQN
jgi:hypothetical protein